MVYLQSRHGWCHMKLLPTRRVLCTPYNHAPCHFMQSHIRKVHSCLAVTCHLHFWQNDRDLLHATAVTRGWLERIPKQVSTQKVDPGEEKYPAAPAGTRTRDLSITIELPPLPKTAGVSAKSARRNAVTRRQLGCKCVHMAVR